MNDIGGFLGGLAVFTALLFGLVIFLFQLRMQIKDSGYETLRPRFTRFIDQVFANVNYAVAIGVLTTALGVIGTSIGDDQGAPVWLSSILVGFCVHLLLTILMCIKRVTSAYEQLS
ncbi:hypothetical protein SEA_DUMPSTERDUDE_43 [Gordonia phage DumpsterDude]|uniref:Uncharacterized protein n=1 Tax=Gordonia phage DumpsterDude TaxID=2713262 RepID=A0A6G8R0D0_9CAUD|nr:hypothetical protein JZX77_gp43 [Gordonia phage DumpsterDude]QIN93631.1 hypothetical protein SEA_DUMPSTERDUDE_43 [Gordonia phage DumpsterDude]